MKYLFELSKEHKTIPKSEILACLKAWKINYKIIKSNENTILIEMFLKKNRFKELADRLSFTFNIDKFLFTSAPNLELIKKNANKNKLINGGSIAIKYKNRSKNIDSQPIIRELANIYTKNRTVTLNNPINEIRALITDSMIYVGIKLAKLNRSKFEERKVQNRPYFSPISLHPKLACALVNLSSIKRGNTLLDPFCGTGGILIEAGLIGMKVIGSDIEEKMIEGCKKSMDFYKIKNYDLFHSDIGEIHKHVDKVDAIVTDMPYGKSTTIKGEKMDQLYNRAFRSMSDLLKENGRAVIGLSNKDFISIGDKYLKQIEKHELMVHKSLNRYFVVYEK
jgi:tRNA (guanine10-N2)-dimethyltransferase